MNKYELVNEIMKLADSYELVCMKLDKANSEIELLKRDTDEEGTRGNVFNSYMIAAGRNAVFEDSIDYWHSVKVSQDEDTGEIKFQTFSNYCELNIREVPLYMSKKEFFKYFDVELHELYEADKEKAIAELKESEEVDDE